MTTHAVLRLALQRMESALPLRPAPLISVMSMILVVGALAQEEFDDGIRMVASWLPTLLIVMSAASVATDRLSRLDHLIAIHPIAWLPDLASRLMAFFGCLMILAVSAIPAYAILWMKFGALPFGELPAVVLSFTTVGLASLGIGYLCGVSLKNAPVVALGVAYGLFALGMLLTTTQLPALLGPFITIHPASLGPPRATSFSTTALLALTSLPLTLAANLAHRRWSDIHRMQPRGLLLLFIAFIGLVTIVHGGSGPVEPYSPDVVSTTTFVDHPPPLVVGNSYTLFAEGHHAGPVTIHDEFGRTLGRGIAIADSQHTALRIDIESAISTRGSPAIITIMTTEGRWALESPVHVVATSPSAKVAGLVLVAPVAALASTTVRRKSNAR